MTICFCFYPKRRGERETFLARVAKVGQATLRLGNYFLTNFYKIKIAKIYFLLS